VLLIKRGQEMTIQITQQIQYTPVIKRIMEELCIPIAPDLKEKTILNILLFHLATIAGYFKIQEGEKNRKVINHYAMVLAYSSYGKDKTKNFIKKHLLKNFYEKFTREAKYFTEDMKHKNNTEALEKFPTQIEKGRDINEKKRNDYLKSLPIPRTILTAQSIRSSAQGLDADVRFISKADKFCINSTESEFSSFFKNASDIDKKIIETYVGLYDGEYTTGSFKHEPIKEDLENIFCNLLLFAQPEALIKKDVKLEIKEILTNGLGRRCFISLDDLEISDNDEYIDNDYYITHCENVLTPLIDNIVQKLENNSKKIVVRSEAAYNIIKNYYKTNRSIIKSMTDHADSVVISDLKNRDYKAIRLAALITCIENPEHLVINKEIMDFAIQLTEIYSNDLTNYLQTKPKDETDELFNKFLENKNKPFSKSDVRNWKILDKKNFKIVIDDEIESVKYKANLLDMDLIVERTSSTGFSYMLTDLLPKQEIKENKDTELFNKMENTDVLTLDHKFLMSYSLDQTTVMNDICIPTKNYVCAEFDMNDLKELLQVSFKQAFNQWIPPHWTVSYSALEYSNGYRKSSNVIGEPEVIILDFDNGMTLGEAKERFKPFLNAISTTKSHKKEKNGVICDRFRVIMPTYPIPKDKFKKVMSNILKYYSSDEQCKDSARLFFASRNSEVLLNEGILFDWRVFEDLYPPVIRTKTERDTNNSEHFVNDPKYAGNVYKKCGVDFAPGKRNSSFFAVCGLLKKEIDNGNITEEQAETEA